MGVGVTLRLAAGLWVGAAKALAVTAGTVKVIPVTAATARPTRRATDDGSVTLRDARDIGANPPREMTWQPGEHEAGSIGVADTLI
jgi:hypothetical protein